MQVYLNKNELMVCDFFPLNKDSTNLIQLCVLYREYTVRNIRHKKTIFNSIMKNKEIVLTIIKQTGLSRKEIYDMIEKRKKRVKGLISDSIALSLIVKDLCIRM